MFSTLTFNSFLIATDDFKHWVIAPKASMTTATVVEGELKTIISSSVSSIPLQVTVKNFDDSDPTFKLDDANLTNENMFKANS